MTTRPSHQARAGQPERLSPLDASYQERVQPWLDACFGRQIASDKTERNHRLLEEALETVQAGGCTASEAHQLVDYVYSRRVGELHQEVGGVMNTLAALCLAHGLDMHECGEIELARVWTKVEKIRAKQAAKPKHSPLPEAPLDAPPCNSTDVESHDRADEVTRLRAGIQAYLDGDYENPRRHRPGKCSHGIYYFDECPNCDEEYFTRLLAPPHVAPETNVERDGGAS